MPVLRCVLALAHAERPLHLVDAMAEVIDHLLADDELPKCVEYTFPGAAHVCYMDVRNGEYQRRELPVVQAWMRSEDHGAWEPAGTPAFEALFAEFLSLPPQRPTTTMTHVELTPARVSIMRFWEGGRACTLQLQLRRLADTL